MSPLERFASRRERKKSRYGGGTDGGISFYLTARAPFYYCCYNRLSHFFVPHKKGGKLMSHFLGLLHMQEGARGARVDGA